MIGASILPVSPQGFRAKKRRTLVRTPVFED